MGSNRGGSGGRGGRRGDSLGRAGQRQRSRTPPRSAAVAADLPRTQMPTEMSRASSSQGFPSLRAPSALLALLKTRCAALAMQQLTTHELTTEFMRSLTADAFAVLDAMPGADAAPFRKLLGQGFATIGWDPRTNTFSFVPGLPIVRDVKAFVAKAVTNVEALESAPVARSPAKQKFKADVAAISAALHMDQTHCAGLGALSAGGAGAQGRGN